MPSSAPWLSSARRATSASNSPASPDRDAALGSDRRDAPVGLRVGIVAKQHRQQVRPHRALERGEQLGALAGRADARPPSPRGARRSGARTRTVPLPTSRSKWCASAGSPMAFRTCLAILSFPALRRSPFLPFVRLAIAPELGLGRRETLLELTGPLVDLRGLRRGDRRRPRRRGVAPWTPEAPRRAAPTPSRHAPATVASTSSRAGDGTSCGALGEFGLGCRVDRIRVDVVARFDRQSPPRAS